MQKFLKKHRINLLIVAIFLISAYAVIIIRQQKTYEKNPGIIPPRSNYDVTLELGEQERSDLEAKLTKYNDLIQNFVPTTGEQEMDLGNGMVGMAETIAKPEANWFFEKSRALEYLGRYNEAIETLNQVFDYYENSSVAWNNLGVLYTNVGEYKYAIMNFEKLVEVFGDPYGDYAERLTQLYLKIGDPEQAGQRYIKYEQAGGSRNDDLMKQIKEMNAQQK